VGGIWKLGNPKFLSDKEIKKIVIGFMQPEVPFLRAKQALSLCCTLKPEQQGGIPF
jgi:hypothetical protein